MWCRSSFRCSLPCDLQGALNFCAKVKPQRRGFERSRVVPSPALALLLRRSWRACPGNERRQSFPRRWRCRGEEADPRSSGGRCSPPVSQASCAAMSAAPGGRAPAPRCAPRRPREPKASGARGAPTAAGLWRCAPLERPAGRGCAETTGNVRLWQAGSAPGRSGDAACDQARPDRRANASRAREDRTRRGQPARLPDGRAWCS